MNFYQLCNARQSCRKYDPNKIPEREKLDRILDAARLSPSACNGQPYHMTLCLEKTRAGVAKAVMGMGMNQFCKDVPAFIVISEKPYCATAALGAKVKGNDYRSIDIGILASVISFAATEEGLGSCILGWLDDGKLRELLELDGTARLVIAIGYPASEDMHRTKKRKSMSELLTER